MADASVTVQDGTTVVQVFGADLLAPYLAAAGASAALALDYSDDAQQWAAQSEAFSVIAGTEAADAAASAAVALSNVGLAGTFATYAALVAGVGTWNTGYAANSLLRVTADETRGGQTSVYKKKVTGTTVTLEYQSGGLITAQYDHLGRAMVPPRLMERRSAGLHLRTTLAAMASGTRKFKTILVYGDSLGLVNYAGVVNLRMLADCAWFSSSPVYSYDTFGLRSHAMPGSSRPPVTGNAASSGNPSAGKFTSTYQQKSNYAKSFIGTDHLFDSDGDYCCIAGVDTFNENGGGFSLWCDHITILLDTDTGGGTAKISIAPADSNGLCPVAASGTWVAPSNADILSGQTLTGGELLVSTNAAAGVVKVRIKVVPGYWNVKVERPTGSADFRLRKVWFAVEDSNAVNVVNFSVGSNDFGSALVGAIPYEAATIAALQPDEIIVASADGLSAYQNFLPMLESAITAAALTYKPTVLVEVNGYANTDASYMDRYNYCMDFCAPRLGWLAPDLLAILGGAAEATRESLIGDGTHPTAAWQLAYDVWHAEAGLIPIAVYEGRTSRLDVLRAGGRRIVTADKLGAIVAKPSDIDTRAMTWSKITGLSSGSGTAVQGASRMVALATGTTANTKLVCQVDDVNMPLGRVANSRPSYAEMIIGQRMFVVTANTQGVLRWMITSDRTYLAAHTGAFPANCSAFGWRLDNLTLRGIAGDSASTELQTSSYTMTANVAEMLTIVVRYNGTYNYRTVDYYVGETLLGSLTAFTNYNLIVTRYEMQNGATAADYKVVVMPPVITAPVQQV